MRMRVIKTLRRDHIISAADLLALGAMQETARLITDETMTRQIYDTRAVSHSRKMSGRLPLQQLKAPVPQIS